MEQVIKIGNFFGNVVNSTSSSFPFPSFLAGDINVERYLRLHRYIEVGVSGWRRWLWRNVLLIRFSLRSALRKFNYCLKAEGFKEAGIKKHSLLLIVPDIHLAIAVVVEHTHYHVPSAMRTSLAALWAGRWVEEFLRQCWLRADWFWELSEGRKLEIIINRTFSLWSRLTVR